MRKEAIEATERDIQARQLPNAGWPECFEKIGEHGVTHLCNAIHVFEGIGEDGQLYLRRVWGLSSVEHRPKISARMIGSQCFNRMISSVL